MSRYVRYRTTLSIARCVAAEDKKMKGNREDIASLTVENSLPRALDKRLVLFESLTIDRSRKLERARSVRESRRTKGCEMGLEDSYGVRCRTRHEGGRMEQ